MAGLNKCTPVVPLAGYDDPRAGPVKSGFLLDRAPDQYDKNDIPMPNYAKKRTPLGRPGYYPAPIDKVDRWGNQFVKIGFGYPPGTKFDQGRLPYPPGVVSAPTTSPWTEKAWRAKNAALEEATNPIAAPSEATPDIRAIAQVFIQRSTTPESKEWWTSRLAILTRLDAIEAAMVRDLTSDELVLRDHILREMREKVRKEPVAPFSMPGAPPMTPNDMVAAMQAVGIGAPQAPPMGGPPPAPLTAQEMTNAMIAALQAAGFGPQAQQAQQGQQAQLTQQQQQLQQQQVAANAGQVQAPQILPGGVQAAIIHTPGPNIVIQGHSADELGPPSSTPGQIAIDANDESHLYNSFMTTVKAHYGAGVGVNDAQIAIWNDVIKYLVRGRLEGKDAYDHPPAKKEKFAADLTGKIAQLASQEARLIFQLYITQGGKYGLPTLAELLAQPQHVTLYNIAKEANKGKFVLHPGLMLILRV